MAYVYADMGGLVEYQQRILQTLGVLEGQIGCKEDLINDTKVKIQAAIGRAEDAERSAYTSLRNAEDMLQEAERRTREYNANLAEDQSPTTTPDFYYENVSECEQEYTYAQANREHAENTLHNFEAYVRCYEQQQLDGIAHFKKLLETSGKFFESYIKKLIEVKKSTAFSDDSASGSSRSAMAASGDNGGAANPIGAIKAAGEQWTNSLPKNQYAALSSYTGSAYININETLRGICSSFHAGNKEKAVLIHNALSASSLPQACTVYRGCSSAALGALQYLPNDQLLGKFFTDKGFMSTSLNRGDAFGGDIELVINVPAGAKGAYVGYLSQLGHSESEVLFDAARVMRITKVELGGGGRRIIYATMKP